MKLIYVFNVSLYLIIITPYNIINKSGQFQCSLYLLHTNGLIIIISYTWVGGTVRVGGNQRVEGGVAPEA